MIAILTQVARSILEAASTYRPKYKDALNLVRLEKTSTPIPVTPANQHLANAIAWVKAAQDAHESGGVAWGYRARRPIRTTYPMGWVNPYPETTGYIIPTMIRYSRLSGDTDCMERAHRMTKWEISIQLPDGGIQGGIYGVQPVASSTFVTGQVLFGLVSAYETFYEDRIRTAAIRAGDWLLSCLNPAGYFMSGYSHFCAPGAKAYEVRTGAAIAELGDMLDENRYRDAASRMADYAISVQQPNAWFAENDLNFNDMPLTHTIGYVMEGLHEIGIRLGRQDCIAAVKRTLDTILPLIRSDGFLAGRWKSDWTPAVEWSCLTGSAQIAGVYLRMYLQTGNIGYLTAAEKLLAFVSYTQELGTGIPGVEGGIRGSYPFGGTYGQWCVLNWATKFYADSLMDYFEAKAKAAGVDGQPDLSSGTKI